MVARTNQAPPPVHTNTAEPPAIQPREIVFPDWAEINLSPAQAEIMECPNDLIFVNAGRFYGKDHILLLKACIKCMALHTIRSADPKWDRMGAKVIMIFLSPTEGNTDDLWDRCIEFLPAIPGIAKNGKPNFHVRQDAGEILIFGGEIVIHFETSTRKDGLRSRQCDVLYVNEASYHKKQTLIDSIFPTCIRAGFAGIIYMSSSAKHLGHWWDQSTIELHQGKGIFHDLGFQLFRGNLYDNPKTEIAQIRALKAIKKANPYSARREWLGWVNVPAVSEFYLGQGESLAFDSSRIASCKLIDPVNPTGPYVVGIDLAGEADAETQGGDYLGVAVIDRNGVIVRIEKHKKTALEDILEILKRINAQYRPRAIVYDANMGILKNEKNAELARMPLKAIAMNNMLKIKFVENLQHHMICQSVRIPDPDMYFRYIQPDYKYFPENLHLFLQELHEYRKFTMKQEYQTRGRIEERLNISYHKGLDGSDDMLDAVVMAFSEIPVPFHIKASSPLHQVQANTGNSEQANKPANTGGGGNFMRAKSSGRNPFRRQ